MAPRTWESETPVIHDPRIICREQHNIAGTDTSSITRIKVLQHIALKAEVQHKLNRVAEAFSDKRGIGPSHALTLQAADSETYPSIRLHRSHSSPPHRTPLLQGLAK